MERKKNNNILHILLRLISISIFNALVFVCVCFFYLRRLVCSFVCNSSFLSLFFFALVPIEFSFGPMCTKAVRRMEMHLDVFNAFAKVRKCTTAVHTLRFCAVLCYVVCFFFIVCSFWCNVCAICNAKRFAASSIRVLCLVIGRQLCVITFDTLSLFLRRFVWEVRSLVWFIVYALRRFGTHTRRM